MRTHGQHGRRRNRVLAKGRLAVERLEPRQMLNVDFGFVDTTQGFAFHIGGTDFDDNPTTPAEPDNIILWTNPATLTHQFAIEWVDDRGKWDSVIGGIGSNDIVRAAQARGLSFVNFDGFLVKAKRGDDLLHADGGGTFGIRTGAPTSFSLVGPIPYQLVGIPVIAYGNSGDDTILGSSAADILQGGPGDDVIYGLDGADTLLGDMGRDVVFGGFGNDSIYGGHGDDSILGQAGDDTIAGDAGDDVAIGGPGDDHLDGGEDNDDLVGDELFAENPVIGSDKLKGGAGDDSLLADNTDKNPEGGDGTDALQAGPSTVALGVSGDVGFRIENHDIEKIDTTGADPGEPTLRDGRRFDRPGPFSGEVELFPGQTLLKAEAGIPDPDQPFKPGPYGPFGLRDQVESQDATPQLDGLNTSGLGPLTNASGVELPKSINGVIVKSGSLDDQVTGSALDDFLEGGAGNDLLMGLSGADALLAGAGDDVLNGGPGGDIIDGDGGMQLGLGGTDILNFETSSAGVSVHLDPPYLADEQGNILPFDPNKQAAKQADHQPNGFPSPGLGGGDAQDDLIVKEDENDSTIELIIGSLFGDRLIYG